MSGAIAVVSASASVGGAELSMLPVLRLLARERRVVALLPGAGPLADRLAELGIETEPSFELGESLRRASASFGRLAPGSVARAAVTQQVELRRALARLRPRVVYCNGFRAQVGATLPARGAGSTVVWHVRDIARPGAAGVTWRALAPAARLIIANSGFSARQPALRHVRRRVRVRTNGIDLAAFAPRPSEPAGPPVIGMAAHLTPWKGHRGFVRLLARARRELPGLSGRIAGAPLYETEANEGYEASLTAEIAARGLTSSCALMAVPPDEMAAFYAGLHCLVHVPERPEPFGRALAEAQAVGVPVVGFDHGAVKDVLGPAGVTVGAGDEAALAREVVALLHDGERRRELAAIGVDRAAELFDEGRYAESVAADILALA